MFRKIVASTFETLGSAVKATGKQAVKQVQKTGEDVARELGLKPLPPAGSEPTQPLAAHNDQQVDRLKQITNRRISGKYQQIQSEIAQLEKKRQNELPAYIIGSPQFDKDGAVKQLEVSQRPTATISAEQPEKPKPKLPPIAVRREQNKAERFRGTAG